MRLIALPALRSTGPFASHFGPNQLDKALLYIVPRPSPLPTVEGVPKRVNHEMAMHTWELGSDRLKNLKEIAEGFGARDN
jgi:hypothetical protein